MCRPGHWTTNLLPRLQKKKAKTIDGTKRVMKAKALADRKIDTLLDDICDILSYVKKG